MKKLIVGFILLFYSLTLFAQTKNEQLLNIKSNLLVNSNIGNDFQISKSFKKKSRGLAVIYSLLLPGMGELYADNYSTGQYFTIADGVIWGFLSGFIVYGNNKEDDYKDYAEAYGGIDAEGKDDDYFGSIGIYQNIEQYNRDKELNRAFDEIYDEGTHYWSWDDRIERKGYRELWLSSENAKNNVRFAVGALLLNRVVSAIFAVRAVNAYNKRETKQVDWNLSFNFDQKPSLPTSLVVNFRHGL